MSFKTEKSQYKEIGETQTSWTDYEMEQFDQEIEPYRFKVFNKQLNKEVNGFFAGGEVKYLEDKGIVQVRWDKDWREILSDSQTVYSIYHNKIKEYTKFVKKLSYYWNWKYEKAVGNFGL